MRTTVVGGLGFLGAAVVDELLRRGDEVTVVEPRGSQFECDERFGEGRVGFRAGTILDAGSLLPSFRGRDEVYHFAGRLGTSELDDDVHGAIAANITGAVNVFETAVATGVPAVFYPSKPNVWRNAYTITKVASEEFTQLYASKYPVRIVSLRYYNAYGPGQATGPVRKIVPTFASHAVRGLPLPIYGSGEQTVDMIYSRDIAMITVDTLRSGYAGPPLDCGRGIAMTVNEVARQINDALGNTAGVEKLPMRSGETPDTRLVADVRPLQQVIGPLRFSSWTDSLRATLAWYERRLAALRPSTAPLACGHSS